MMHEQIPSWQDFHKAAETANLIGLGLSMTYDHETAINLADRFCDQDEFFLLESATSGPGHIARYSFIGFDALWTWSADLQVATSTLAGQTELISLRESNPIAGLERRLSQFKVAHLFASAPSGLDLKALCGASGFIGYDLASALEPRIGPPPPRQLGLPATYFMIPRHLLILDHLTHRLHLIVYCSLAQSGPASLAPLYTATVKKLTELQQTLSRAHHAPKLKLSNFPPKFDEMTATLSKEKFCHLARRCLEDIKNGEIFQIQIGNRLSQKVKARPFDIFRHLRILNPSPYMFFYQCNQHVILGASPEMMVNVDGDLVTHRPIAGTRKRTWQPAYDLKMKRELLESEKERAEHIMLVDLSRNDIGRIARPGSVEVQELMVVEEYSHVFHMVSQVVGRLQTSLSAADAMIASFPNGTVSGAPKVRAMELIYQYEPVAREFYAGSLGIFTFNGNLKSTLLIRSIHLHGGIASTQASAGIVYDSTPEDEWKETRHKMAACVTAIQNTH